MQIKKNATVAVIVYRRWANFEGVRRFLGQKRDIAGPGSDESLVMFANVLDFEDPKGLWIELNTAKHETDPKAKPYKFLVPWGQVLGVVLADEFPADIRERVGYV